MTMDKTVDSPVVVEFDGQKYKLKQVTTQDYGEIIRYLKTLYIGEVGKSMRMAGVKEDKIIAEIAKLQFEEWGVKGENQKEIAENYDKRIKPLMSSNEAMSYILYMGLRKEQPDLTLEKANNIIASSPGEIGDLITYAMGGIAGTPKRKNAVRAKK